MTNKIYCTYFDWQYIVQGLTMIRSLREFDSESQVVILALDEQTEKFLINLRLLNVVIINEFPIEREFKNLSIAKKNRNKIEYYFTLTPALLRYILLKNSNQTSNNLIIIYLDADLYFFSNPEIIFENFEDYSVAITPHRFNNRLNLNKMKKYGEYNVGILLFRNDSDGILVLNWWLEQCITWCYDIVSEGKFADQKYLERFFDISENVYVLKNEGVNVAPWNIGNLTLNFLNNKLTVNNVELILFHFHGLKLFHDKILVPHVLYKASLNDFMKEHIYKIYFNSLKNTSTLYNIKRLNKHTLVTQNKRNYSGIKENIKILLMLLTRNYIKISKEIK